MKKIILCLSLIVLITGVFSSNIYADETILGGDSGYSVELNASYEFNKDNYAVDIQKALSKMQPGDKAEIKYSITNNYVDEPKLDWYMSNEAYTPFENDTRASVDGGGYSYELDYINPEGKKTVLYDSNSVGGENSEGLKDATVALAKKENEDTAYGMFYLDTLKAGESGQIIMKFELDGESQPNAYQEVVGKIKINFGVEIPTGKHPEPDEPEPKEETVIKEEKKTVKARRTVYLPYTGDDSKLPYFVLVELLLLNALLATAIAYLAYKKKQEAR